MTNGIIIIIIIDNPNYIQKLKSNELYIYISYSIFQAFNFNKCMALWEKKSINFPLKYK